MRAMEWLTAALVLVTAYYAWQNHRMVRQMRATRAAEVVPVLLPEVHLIGSRMGVLRITNVGRGPAVDVAVQLRLLPGGAPRVWTTSFLAPGDHHSFAPDPSRKNGGANLDDLVSAYERVELTGSCRDVLGTRQEIARSMNIKEFWELSKAAEWLMPAMDPIVKGLQRIEKAVDGVARGLESSE